MGDQIVYIDDFAIDTCVLLGQGACGKVFSATRKNDNKLYCAKIVNAKSQNVQKELEIINYMRDKQNENIVNVYYCNFIPDRGFFVIIMEKCESDLEKEIKQRNEQKRSFTEQEAIEVMRQLFNGYRILYQSQVIHRDIKPANILTLQGKYKIADFGVGKIYSSDQNLLNITKKGTPVFKAPELQGNYEYSQNDLNYIQGNPQKFLNVGSQILYNSGMQTPNQNNQQAGYKPMFFEDKEIKQKLMHKVDIYSFGILFYHLLTGGYPFELNMQGIFDFITKIKQTPFRMPPQYNISANTCQLIERMITYSPVQRIDFPSICSWLGLGRLQTMYKREQVIIAPLKQASLTMNMNKIIIIPQYKPIQDWLQQYRNLFYEKCCENNEIILIYRNYCDLCLNLVIYLLDDKVNQELVKDYIAKYQQQNKCDIEFKIEAKQDKDYYLDEYCRVLKSQFIPKVFNYEQIKNYGEQHLKFMLISQKLIKGYYSYKQYLQNGNLNYSGLKDLIQKEAGLSKEQLKQQLDDLF